MNRQLKTRDTKTAIKYEKRRSILFAQRETQVKMTVTPFLSCETGKYSAAPRRSVNEAVGK